MKKLAICLLAVILFGCQKAALPINSSQLWEGQYKKGDIQLILTYESDFPEGFQYDFRYQGDDMSDYATYDDETQKTALSAVTEDGYTLRFTLDKDKVIIEEMNGQSYLDITLSGDYLKE